MNTGERLILAFQQLMREDFYRKLREPRVVHGPMPDKLPQFPGIVPEQKPKKELEK